MKLKDIEHLLPSEARDLMAILQAVGLAFEDVGAAVTDLGYDFRQQRAEMALEHPDKGRMEVTLRWLT